MQESELRAYKPEPVDRDKVKHVHFIGVAGTGMGTLAGMLKQDGFTVTGSDQGIYPPMSTQLEDWGIPVKVGFQPDHLDPRPDLVIVGNACRPSNPEVQAAIKQGIPCTSMPRLLKDFFLKNRHVVVVAGTHGKTTTTALAGWILTSAGLEPGVLVGGVCPNFNGSFQLPKGEFFVIEGDEYDSALFDKVPKFVHYNPRSVVLTSVEFDHADIYPDLEAVKKAFRRLMHAIPKDGKLLVCGDYPIATEISKLCQAPVENYGTSPEQELHAGEIEPSEEGVHFTLYRNKDKIRRFLLPMFGHYNISNAVAAIGIALELGVSPKEIQRGLSSFRGIKRRQEIIAEIGELLLIDDFAHHPTAIRVTIEAIRERFPKRRIIGIFEPRSNTARRNYFQKELPESFRACDIALLAWPYGHQKMEEEERLDIQKVIQDIDDMGKKALAFPKVEQIASYVTAKARPNDVIVIMSNGGFGGLHKMLKNSLEQRFGKS